MNACMLCDGRELFLLINTLYLFPCWSSILFLVCCVIRLLVSKLIIYNIVMRICYSLNLVFGTHDSIGTFLSRTNNVCLVIFFKTW
jgi:hypothetical protein